MKHKDFHLKRIYNSNNDGRYLKNLYEKCDKKQLILLVFESEEGYKFGGFIQEFVVLEPYDYDIHRPHGHLRIFKDMFYFEYAICCSESKGKSFLDDCSSTSGTSANEYWGGIKEFIPGYFNYKRIKTLEAFQVIIDKNE